MSDERTTDLAEEIDEAITGRMYGMFTGLPGKVLAFDAGEQSATIQPEPVTYHGSEVIKLPALHDVPVMFPQGGGYRMTWPLKAGDRVWLSFACRPLDAWKAGVESEPGGLRSHALSDAVALPMGPRPLSAPLAGFDVANVEIREPTGGLVALGSSPRKAVARVDDTTADGTIAIATVPVSGGVGIAFTYTPPSGAPQVATVSIIGAVTGAGAGTLNLAGKIDSGSAKVEAG